MAECKLCHREAGAYDVCQHCIHRLIVADRLAGEPEKPWWAYFVERFVLMGFFMGVAYLWWRIFSWWF